MAGAMEAVEYRKLAEVEDRMWYFRSLHRHFARELQRAGMLGNHRTTGATAPHVLDAGCGTGGLMLRLRAVSPDMKLSGIDIMPLAVELARQRCAAVAEIHQGDITAMPFQADMFDAIVSADAVSETPDAAAALAEFARVLRSGGVLLLNLPAYMWLWSYHDEAVHTQHRYNRGEVAEMLTKAGFRVERLTHWNALPLPLVWARRKLFSGTGSASDVKPYPWAIDGVLSAAMALEHAWLQTGGNWAWGVSVFAVARKV
jgi:SAM-dependent methyltransferase